MEALQIETEKVPAMLSLDDKNYILWDGSRLKIHGSSLKGRHLPIVCDKFRDALCEAVFKGDDPLTIFKIFQNLKVFNVHDFQIRVYSTKGYGDYAKTGLYSNLLKKMAARGIRVPAGSSLEYVKATSGYLPVLLFSEDDRIDYKYYKLRLAEIASRILNKDASALAVLLGCGQVSLEEFA